MPTMKLPMSFTAVSMFAASSFSAVLGPTPGRHCYMEFNYIIIIIITYINYYTAFLPSWDPRLYTYTHTHRVAVKSPHPAWAPIGIGEACAHHECDQ
jgi:hypothetical protein